MWLLLRYENGYLSEFHFQSVRIVKAYGEVRKVSPTLNFGDHPMATQSYLFCLGGLALIPRASDLLALPSLRIRICCDSCPGLIFTVEVNNTLQFVIIDSKLPPACTNRSG